MICLSFRSPKDLGRGLGVCEAGLHVLFGSGEGLSGSLGDIVRVAAGIWSEGSLLKAIQTL